MKPIRLRVKLNYRPAFTGPIEGWLTNYLKKNYWRVDGYYEYEDVFQEAYIVFLRVSRKYPEVEARHFMSLFKTAWSNKFTDMTNVTSLNRAATPLPEQDSGEESGYEVVGDLDNSGALLIALEQAPSEVRQVLKLLLAAPLEILELAQSCWRSNGKNSADGNNLINEALGRPKGTDSIGAVVTYFTNPAV